MKRYRYYATTTFTDFGHVEAENEENAKDEALGEVERVIREKRSGEIYEDTEIEVEEESEGTK